MKKKLFSLFLLLVVCFFLGCAKKYPGKIAFRSFGQTVYHNLADPVKFNANETVEWIYILDTPVMQKTPVAIFLQKKELVWVNVYEDSQNFSPEKNVLYGKIENYDAGQYKLIFVLDEDNIISKKFIIYAEKK